MVKKRKTSKRHRGERSVTQGSTGKLAEALTMAGKKGRSGRRKGSLSWSKNPAALAGHYLNGLIEMWLAGVAIPTRPDWWASAADRAQAHCAAGDQAGAGPSRHRVRRVAGRQSYRQAIGRVGDTDRRSHGRALIKCWRGRAGWRRPLRYAARPTVQRGRRRRGHGRSGLYDWRMRGKPGVTGSSGFVLSPPAA